QALEVGLRQVAERGRTEAREPQARRQRDPDARRRLGRTRTDGGDCSPPGSSGRARADEAPGEAREQQRDRELHAREEERVVLLSLRDLRGDVERAVDAVRQAAAGELGDEGEERERGRRGPTLVTPHSG